jgi:hypothetical protein
MRIPPLPCQPAATRGHRRLIPMAGVALLALLSACANNPPPLDQSREAATYRARTHDYSAPGPASDPWRPYIVEAAERFDVPERWIREVMRAESGGHAEVDGQPITSPVGAMGLMQVMPETYETLRVRYALGDDPYDPHNSILAGGAYIREMYELYGSPGFLAAYNAGPGRLEDYLHRNRTLPDETRRYVAMIGPYIRDSQPKNPIPDEQFAGNMLPVEIPPGPRHQRQVFAVARVITPPLPPRGAHGVQVAELPRPSRAERGAAALVELPVPPRPVAPPAQLAAVAPPIRQGLHLINPAMADTLPLRGGGGPSGAWAIQVGAFGNESLARAAVGSAKDQAHENLAVARPMVASVQQGHAVLYRARLLGLSHEAAMQACERLSHGRTSCTVLSPAAQS